MNNRRSVDLFHAYYDYEWFMEYLYATTDEHRQTTLLEWMDE